MSVSNINYTFIQRTMYSLITVYNMIAAKGAQLFTGKLVY